MFTTKIFPCIINRCTGAPKNYIHTTSLVRNETKIEKSINQVTLLGRVGNDPQVRGTEDHPVVTFSLATHNNYRYESGDMLQRTDWHRISVFKPTLREMVSSYMKKGQRIYITGRLTYGEIKTDDGLVRPTTSIVADDVIFLQNSSNNNSTES